MTGSILKTPAETDPTNTADPEETEEQPDVQDAPAISKWPWWVSAVVAGVVLVVLIAFIIAGWYYLTGHTEAQEKEDYEQLLNLIDRVQNVTLFVLGAIFGVTASGAAASGAASAAKHNKDEAKKQHGKAKKNEGAAKKNKRVAELAKSDALAVTDKLDDLLKSAKADRGVVKVRVPYNQLDRITLDTNQYASLRRDDDPSPKVTAFPLRPDQLYGYDEEPDYAEAEDLAAQVRSRWSDG